MNHFAALIGKLKSVTKPVTMTTIPCNPKSSGDSNRANTIVVAVCTTNFAPCAETAAISPGHGLSLQVGDRGLRKGMMQHRTLAHSLLKIRLYCSSKALRDFSTFCLMTVFSFSAFFSTSWNCSINLPTFI